MRVVAPQPRSRIWGARRLAWLCLVLLALNLRPVVNAVGAVVPELRADTGLSAPMTGLLLSLPMLCFALLGTAAPVLSGRFGPHRTVVAALGLLALGQLVRAGVPGTAALFAGSVVALAGVAIGNVVMPGLVRLHFADRIPFVTAAYTTSLTLGATAAVALSNPIEHAAHGTWRVGLGSWTALAVLAVPPWLVLTHRARQHATASATTDPGPDDVPPAPQRLPLRAVARTRVAWALALYFGVQAMLAYVIMGWLPEILTDRGMTQAAGAVQVAVIIAVGVPPALLVSGLLGRVRRPEILVVTPCACYLAGFLGLLGAASTPAVLACSVLIGIGTAAFPLALSLIAMRSRSAPVTTSLSAFAQSTGYLVAAAGPVVFGALYDATGAWTVPLLTLAAGSVVQAVFGTVAVRSCTVEDELRLRRG